MANAFLFMVDMLSLGINGHRIDSKIKLTFATVGFGKIIGMNSKRSKFICEVYKFEKKTLKNQ